MRHQTSGELDDTKLIEGKEVFGKRLQSSFIINRTYSIMHDLIDSYFKMYFSTILLSMSRSPKWSLSIRFPTKILYAFLEPH